MINLLLTSTSFQDTPGKHQNLLNSKNGVEVSYLRGPVLEKELLGINWNYTGVICGDDEYTYKVLKKAKSGGLKVLSKYGVGLDKVDLPAAKELGIKVVNCIGVNQTTVAEHVFALLLSYSKHIQAELSFTAKGEWKRFTGSELKDKNILIVGLGKIGKEVANLAKAFSMNVFAYDKFLDKSFCEKFDINEIKSLSEDLKFLDFLSLHCNLNSDSSGMIDKSFIFEKTSDKLVIVNTARAHLVKKSALLEGLSEGKIKGALFDVWYDEPMKIEDATSNYPGLHITPHIASRTQENVEKQGLMSIDNLFRELE